MNIPTQKAGAQMPEATGENRQETACSWIGKYTLDDLYYSEARQKEVNESFL